LKAQEKLTFVGKYGCHNEYQQLRVCLQDQSIQDPKNKNICEVSDHTLTSSGPLLATRAMHITQVKETLIY